MLSCVKSLDICACPAQYACHAGTWRGHEQPACFERACRFFSEMRMKRTDLEKNKALKIMGKMKAATPPARFAGETVLDRREQRRLDQAAGLVSFPVKLTQPVIDALNARAAADGVSMNELVNRLLGQALEQ